VQGRYLNAACSSTPYLACVSASEEEEEEEEEDEMAARVPNSARQTL
jgi:hypothetical protein